MILVVVYGSIYGRRWFLLDGSDKVLKTPWIDDVVVSFKCFCVSFELRAREYSGLPNWVDYYRPIIGLTNV